MSKVIKVNSIDREMVDTGKFTDENCQFCQNNYPDDLYRVCLGSMQLRFDSEIEIGYFFEVDTVEDGLINLKKCHAIQLFEKD